MMGLRVKLGCFEGEVSVPAKGDPSGVVVDNGPAVGLVMIVCGASGTFPVMRSR